MFITGAKCLQTIWDELTAEFEDLQYLNFTADSVWNAARDKEMERNLTREELKRLRQGQASREIHNYA
jgi:hypothetical protein